MSETLLSNIRLKLFKLVQLIAPEGSSLDAVFNSYDDGRQMREKSTSENAAGASAKRESPPQ
jgi:hypothetical protein